MHKLVKYDLSGLGRKLLTEHVKLSDAREAEIDHILEAGRDVLQCKCRNGVLALR